MLRKTKGILICVVLILLAATALARQPGIRVEAQSGAQSEAQAGVLAETPPKAQSQAQSETRAEAQEEVQAGTQGEAQDEAQAEAQEEAQAKAQAEAQEEAQAQARAEEQEGTSEISEAPAKMEKVCESKDLELYIDMSSTRFAVRDKNSGIIWYGTPPGYNQDSIANKAYKEIMSSNILLTYIDETGEKTLSSFTNAVAFDQFNVEKIENGVSIEYMISDKAMDELVIPLVMPHSYMKERIFPHLDENERLEMLQNYVNLSVKEDIIKSYVKRHRIKQYPFIVEEDIYVFIPTRRSALNKAIVLGYLE
ncbi:MAG: hypothetical protein GX754_05195, partial [Clostridiaceae bacterium]|nr:hypothetical protein [Clostridiaceae bacterium]